MCNHFIDSVSGIVDRWAFAEVSEVLEFYQGFCLGSDMSAFRCF